MESTRLVLEAAAATAKQFRDERDAAHAEVEKLTKELSDRDAEYHRLNAAQAQHVVKLTKGRDEWRHVAAYFMGDRVDSMSATDARATAVREAVDGGAEVEKLKSRIYEDEKHRPDLANARADADSWARQCEDARDMALKLGVEVEKLRGLIHSEMIADAHYCEMCEMAYQSPEGCKPRCPYCEVERLRATLEDRDADKRMSVAQAQENEKLRAELAEAHATIADLIETAEATLGDVAREEAMHYVGAQLGDIRTAPLAVAVKEAGDLLTGQRHRTTQK